MIFESTVLWDEKELFSECGRAEQGYMGYAKYIFTESGFGLQVNTFRDYTVEIQSAINSVLRFLQSEDALCVLRSLLNMTVICESHINDHIVYLGGNEQSTHKYISEQLGKATIDTNTYGRSDGLRGNFSTNYQLTGRELMTPDEVRMLDNKYCIAFIRGERPVLDFKYDILRHPNVKLSRDGGAPAYVHGFGELEGDPWANGASEGVSDITEEVETMYAEKQNREVIALDELEFAMYLEKIKKESEKENKE